MKTIKNVELFAAGTWRGSDSPPTGYHYTTRDLQAMVDAFSGGAIRPKIKITHGSDTEQVNVGEVGNLRVIGNKLLGDFVNLDGNLYQLMKKGLFKARSAEVLWNMRDRVGRTWRRVLKAVALLTPGQKPAVPLAEGYQFEKLYSYEWPQEGQKMDKKEAQRILDQGANVHLQSGKAKNYSEAFEMSMTDNPEAKRAYLPVPEVKQGTTEPASVEVDRLANQYVKEGKAADYSKAVMMVFNDRRDLKVRYAKGG